jgi:hypothetical protein|tara:strand:+ start:9872 stop:10834 length:963 start_codon:yes stop_codon:yes gene_type:complete
MGYNLNAGYGKATADALHGLAGTAGKVFVVAKSAAAGRQILQDIFGGDPDGKGRYYGTIDEAVNQTTASRGDTILVAEGHTEDLSDATTLNLDVAGVRILGLGAGSTRPTITFDTATTATIPVSAANVTVENMIFTANFADIVSVFTLAAAANFALRNCYIKATATSMNFLYVVDTNTTTSAASGLTIEGCKWIDPDLVCESLVKMDGDNSDVTIRDNFVQLGVNNNTASLLAVITNKSVFNLQMTGNRVFRLNTDTATGAILLTTDQADNSGVVANNFAQHADTASELLITASSGLGTFENYASGVAGASGYLLPAADS